MAVIPNFPKDLLDQHHQWHEAGAHGPLPLRSHAMGARGGGTEFLTFYRNFSAQVMDWYQTTTFTTAPFDNPAQKASLVAPWFVVPPEMRAQAEYAFWSAAEARLESGNPNFDNDDELGYFVESGIHNQFLHKSAGIAFNDEIVKTFHSPQSSLFYKIHGLVGHWWSRWQRRNVFSPHPMDRLVNPGASEVLHPEPMDRLVNPGASEAFRPDQAVLAGSRRQFVESIEFAHLRQRVALLESRVFPMHASTATLDVAGSGEPNYHKEERYSRTEK